MKARDYPYFHPPFAAMAHRGGAELPANRGHENTLVAFSHAIDLGFGYLETDVHLTRDGHLVAFHDDTLDRVTDSTGRIADLTLAQVHQARIGSHHVPMLEEVLTAFPEAMVNIDIKAPGAEAPLVRLLRRLGAEHRVCVGSFSEVRLRRFRRLSGGRVATSCGPVGVLAGVLASRLGHGPAPRGAVFQVPMQAKVAGRHVEVVTPEFIQQAHHWGKRVHVWTIDDPQTMHTLLDWDVDGIVTDRPDVLRSVLDERGMWS